MSKSVNVKGGWDDEVGVVEPHVEFPKDGFTRQMLLSYAMSTATLDFKEHTTECERWIYHLCTLLKNTWSIKRENLQVKLLESWHTSCKESGNCSKTDSEIKKAGQIFVKFININYGKTCDEFKNMFEQVKLKYEVAFRNPHSEIKIETLIEDIAYGVAFGVAPREPHSEMEIEIKMETEIEAKAKTETKKTQCDSIKRGKLIVFEGTDRVGKSTQAVHLHRYLKVMGIPCELWSFPDRTTQSGKWIDSHLKKEKGVEFTPTMLSCLFTENRIEKRDAMLDLLERGVHIILDRYIISGVAMSIAQGLDEKECLDREKGLPEPDVTFYMRMPIEKTMQRNGFGQEHFETKDFQKKAQCAFDKLFYRTTIASDPKAQQINKFIGKLVQIDASDSIENIMVRIKLETKVS